MTFYRGMTCENLTIEGYNETPITAYVAKPSGPGLFPGVVLVHHLPGWSEFYIETTRRFAHHGYLAICANLYERAGQGDPDDVAAKVRADGGIPDAQVVGDTDAAVKWMRTQTNHNGKIGVFGSCSGGRHAVIYACQRKDVDACADLWGGRVVMGKEELNDKTPMAPIDMTFARALAPLTRPEDLVWVHDYHLIPLAEELRAFALTDRFIVLLNGVQKTDFTNPDANRGKAEDGSRFIGLQTHTGRVLFRNLEIKKLP